MCVNLWGPIKKGMQSLSYSTYGSALCGLRLFRLFSFSLFSFSMQNENTINMCIRKHTVYKYTHTLIHASVYTYRYIFLYVERNKYYVCISTVQFYTPARI
jgi:hypothetical protein